MLNSELAVVAGAILLTNGLTTILYYKIKKKLKEIENISTRDSLTGLMNRRVFNDFASKEVNRAVREKQPLSLLMIDVDFFKSINDNYGHCIGDIVLREVALILDNSTRMQDLVCRYGGEEFVILLSPGNEEGALWVAERIQGFLKDVKVDGMDKPVTVSCGISTEVPLSSEDPKAFIHRMIDQADKALYEAKNAGRNCIRS